MGFFDKLFPGKNEDEDDLYENEDDLYDFPEDEQPQPTPKQSPAYGQNSQRSTGMGMSSGALEMKVVKPERYDSATARKIADHLLNDRTVVLNLEASNKEAARRLIDFLSGVAYSIDGYIQRVANNTFVIVPKSVDVSGDHLKGAQNQDDSDLL
ncbi:MAG: cell division protein SepF [Ruminococcaceae bacterium]|nr:cell division protein SepF [Oscillospiraceae bacterium]